jgi:hypothetical protein
VCLDDLNDAFIILLWQSKFMIFMGPPPKTRQDLRDYLTTWLEDVVDDSPLSIDGETFIQEKGFRRAGYIHCVFRSTLTNEYVWWVSEMFDPKDFPKTRYDSYDSLLENVINEYYTQWGLTD